MNLTKEYIAECEDCVFRNFNQIDGDRKSDRVQERIKIIKDFIKCAKTILSVGCGSHEPIDINATHAIDIASNSEGFLRKQGWKGLFYLGSCDELPQGWGGIGGKKDVKNRKKFDAAVCSEVIEHLPSLEMVKRTFNEVNHVARKWIFTCPDWVGTEPTHKRAFTEKMLKGVLSEIRYNTNIEIKHIGRYWYVLHPGN